MPLSVPRIAALAATGAVAAALVVAAPVAPSSTAPGVQPGVPGAEAEASGPAGGTAGRGGRTVSTTGASTAAASPPGLRAASAEGPERDAVLPRVLTGRQVLDSRAEALPELARRNGLTQPELRELLADETVRVATSGRAFFADPAPRGAGSGHGTHGGHRAEAAEAATAAGSGAGVPLTALYPQAQTFQLHSRPGSSRTIFLDFDGATVSGTAWNDPADRTLRDGTWVGWDSDGNAAGFTDAERAWVQHVWRQVAESYAAFDVDVTTADPGADALRRSSVDDRTFGARVVFTSDTTANDQACGGCFGIAFNSVFGEVDPTGWLSPAWVFVDNPAYSPVLAAQGAAHEVGHTLGLGHDGLAGSTYFGGTPSWGPIMGLATMRATSQWSQGEYAGASNRQDDLAVMTAHRLPLRTDDHADTTASATPLVAGTPAAGVITSRSDVDTFRVDLACATTLSAAVKGIGPQSPLDLSLELLDASGRPLDRMDPTSGYTRLLYPLGGLWYPLYESTGMDSSLDRALDAGTYYLRVDGVGRGDAAADGYSDYASIGSYTLTAYGCTTSPSPSPTTSPTTTPSPSATPTTPAPSSPAPTTPAPTTPAPTTPAPTSPAPVVLTKPGAPTIGTASSGARGGTVSATARWTAPRSTGGQKLLGYRVRAYKLDYRNRVVRTYTTGRTAANVGTLVYRLPRGRYTFVVRSENGLGASAWSARSRIVTAR